MSNKHIFNASILKCIAVFTMLIDHIGIMLAGTGVNMVVYSILRCVGRLAFPLFCFLLVEGFVHTRSCGKYILRIFLFAILSEIPYDLLNFGNFINLTHNNILFTFTIAIGMLFLLSKCVGKGTKGIVAAIIIVTVFAGLSVCFRTEYSWRCIFIVAFFYIARSNFMMRNISVAAILLIDTSWVGLMALFALIPINGYNGEKGKFPKWIGYAFYPIHILILWSVDRFIL